MSNLQLSSNQTAAVAQKTCYFVFPGDLNTPTGGYRYDREVIRGLQKQDWRVSLISLEGSYPSPRESDKELALAALAGIELSALVIVDGLALGALPELAEKIAECHHLIALVHHPLFLESGLEPKIAERLRNAETKALSFAEHVVVTSPSTQEILISHMNVPAEKVSIVLPGIDQPDVSEGISGDHCLREIPQLLCVGSLVPRKGQLHLVEALGHLKHLNWRLDLVGETRFDPAYTKQVREQIKRWGLADRIKVHGGVPKADLTRLYKAADLFVLPSCYEGYGMAFTEAMSFGLPIIASGEGAVASTVPASAGLHVAPGDVQALRDAIETMLRDEALRRQFSKGSFAAAQALPSWPESTKAFAAVLDMYL